VCDFDNLSTRVPIPSATTKLDAAMNAMSEIRYFMILAERKANPPLLAGSEV
jgi:hypothetical protein